MKLVFLCILFSQSLFAKEDIVLKEVLNQSADQSQYDISKDQFNSQRQNIRVLARQNVNNFITWCFNNYPYSSNLTLFDLDNISNVLKSCYETLNQAKCDEKSKNQECLYLARLKKSRGLAVELDKILGNKPDKLTLVKTCKKDLKKIDEMTKPGVMCTQSIVSLICPYDGQVYNVTNGCDAGNLVTLGWKRSNR